MATDPSTEPANGPRVLVIRPPEVPTYFNAGHHLPVFMVSAYLRAHLGDSARVDAIDAAALNVTWRELADRLWDGHYDVIACMNDLGEVPALGELVARVRGFGRPARIITFGRMSSLVPKFFERYDLDGIVQQGDYEAGILAFIRWVAVERGPRPGVAVKFDSRWLPPDGPGEALPAGQWVLPDVREVPYPFYDRLYQRDRSQFCGLPDRRELVVPVARGCPVRCGFCEVWVREGARERRLPVGRVVDYISKSRTLERFDYVAMYAPTFTLNRQWTLQMCDALAALGDVAWKCTTTIECLDETLLEHMAASGCVRVSVGLETLESGAQSFLPSRKRMARARFDQLAACCARVGVELNCFVILGLPGATIDGTLETARHVRSMGARLRPTFYTPYHDMRADMDEHEISRFNRQLAPGHLSAADAGRLYELVHAET
jgi:radical SAM superfamily enzyme YgiQ (UPF0313 family)